MLDIVQASRPIRNPTEDEVTHLQRWRDFMRLGNEQCNGYNDGILATLINMVADCGPM